MFNVFASHVLCDADSKTHTFIL